MKPEVNIEVLLFLPAEDKNNVQELSYFQRVY